MSVRKIIFPESLANITSSVTHLTTVTRGSNAAEVRNAEWQDFLRRYNASYSVRNEADIAELRQFFIMVRGRETAFLLKDILDYKITEQVISGVEVPNGVKTTFQIFRAYDDTLLNFITRDVTYIKSGTVTVANASSTYTEGVHYTLNYDTGVITFASAPTTGTQIKVTCQYYIPVRFDTDEMPFDLFLFETNTGRILGNPPDVPMIEVRV